MFCCELDYVYVIEQSAGSRSQFARLEADDAQVGAYFGRSGAFEGQTPLIGAFHICSSGAAGTFSESSFARYSQQAFGPGGTILAGSTWKFQGWFRDPAM